jgi:hypothetical protein
MGTLKSLLLQICMGMALGTLVADVTAPGILTWYNIPGGGQALCNCADLVRSTANSLVNAHLIGAGVGAVVCLILGLLLRRKPAHPAPLPVPPATP